MATKTTKKATKTIKLTIAQMLQVIAEMTVLELSELVKAIEEKFNVSAMPVMTGPAVEVVEEKEEEVQTEFLVVMSDFGSNRIQVIKAVREQTKESLMVCRDMVTNLGQPLQEGMSEGDATEFASKLTAVGATVEVK
jgi:large subunit ribosomal protein L7/L12